MKNLLIVVLMALLVWFGAAIVRLENYHYANQVGMCGERPVGFRELIAWDRCLNETQTRTGPLWHLAHGLGVLG